MSETTLIAIVEVILPLSMVIMVVLYIIFSNTLMGVYRKAAAA